MDSISEYLRESKPLEIKQLTKALIAVQKEMKAIHKDATNPFYKSKYVQLDSVVGYLYPLLTQHGFCISQLIQKDCLQTILMHESGEYLISNAPLPQIADIQKLLAASTYLRRYSLMAIVGLAPSDDDDGNCLKDQTATNKNASAIQTASVRQVSPPPQRPQANTQQSTSNQVNQLQRQGIPIPNRAKEIIKQGERK